jgi:hypothetical protein
MSAASYNGAMQDRPTADELLTAVEHFLDDLTANLDGSRSFHARVAANAVRIVRREIQTEDEALAAEWAGLDSVLGPEQKSERLAETRNRLRERNTALSALIQAGQADNDPVARQVFEHVRATLRTKLSVSDPALLERSDSA